ncbi:MAG: response regulator transcription factor [Desulfarculus sp.]|nr:response regulator transcription factor [Pseudomonadota bacterium]MBV1715860.1 response regulator transcription factor [Desulfarculus sp.]MBU4575067.1 response regulator transcription factor [Pseudomonadota bacterium]MBU4600213.1 response regulator transcription factor [Pseudomonadota bacterium]MBV1738585.1 response regulator transcription factor [Desulfarculus sp.]
MSQKHSVVICDDHGIVREGIKQVLASNPALEVVGEAANGLEGLALISKLRPDVVVTDITMPEMNGIDMTRELTKEFPDIRVVILSVHSRKTFIMEALKAGARGYVLKDSAGEKLLDAVQAVLAGDSYLDSPVAGHIVDEFVKLPSPTEPAGGGGESLTDRERQILSLVVEGFSNKQIAEKLFLSPKTVDNHRAKIMSKLGRRDVIGLVKYALATGLVDPDTWGR